MDDVDVSFAVSLPLLIQTVIATVLPLLVGLVTKTVTRGGVKAALLALLSIISSGLTELLAAMTQETLFDFGTWLVWAIGTFAVAVSAHYGFWKPTGVTGAVQSVGPKHPPEPEQNAGSPGTGQA